MINSIGKIVSSHLIVDAHLPMKRERKVRKDCYYYYINILINVRMQKHVWKSIFLN